MAPQVGRRSRFALCTTPESALAVEGRVSYRAGSQRCRMGLSRGLWLNKSW